jgi:hypothetical protein
MSSKSKIIAPIRAGDNWSRNKIRDKSESSNKSRDYKK